VRLAGELGERLDELAEYERALASLCRAAAIRRSTACERDSYARLL